MNKSLLEIKDLTKIYHTKNGEIKAIDNISFNTFIPSLYWGFLKSQAMDTVLFHFPLYASCILDFGITEANYHADVMVGRNVQHCFDIRHLFQRTERERQHYRSKAAGSTKKFKICPGNHHILYGFPVAERCVGNQNMWRSAKKHIGAHRLFPSFHIFICLFAKPLWLDPLRCQCLHPGINNLAEVIHLDPIIDQCEFHLLLIATVGRP